MRAWSNLPVYPSQPLLFQRYDKRYWVFWMTICVMQYSPSKCFWRQRQPQVDKWRISSPCLIWIYLSPLATLFSLSHPALIYMSDKSLPLARVRAKSNTGWINECRKLFPNTPWREAPSLNLGCCQSSAIMMKHLLSRSLQQSHVFPGNL